MKKKSDELIYLEQEKRERTEFSTAVGISGILYYFYTTLESYNRVLTMETEMAMEQLY